MTGTPTGTHKVFFFMSKAIPSYLLNRNNIWYFRKRIPKNKVIFFNKNEVKLSLQTSNLNVAKIKGFKLLSIINNKLNAVETQVEDKDQFIQIITHKDPEFGEVSFEHETQEQELASLLKYQSMIQGFKDKNKSKEVIPLSLEKKTNSILLSEAIDQYRLIKKSDDTFNNDTLIANIAKLNTLVEIVGNTTLDALTFDISEKVKNVLQKLPKNRQKLKAYKNKSISQLLEMDISIKDRLSPTTVTNYLEKISSFITWCVKREYCEKNYFSGLSNSKGKKKKNSEERFPWYSDQLTIIFSHKVFTELKFTHPYYYWHPLIALHGGQRMNEISQLYVNDIVKEEGVWCFKHTEKREDQRLKTVYSERHIPIHSKLIELGFLKFIQHLKVNNEERVFPELSYTNKAGYSKDVSKWFGRFRKSSNLHIEEVKQDFHSFRHGVSQRLKYADVQEEKVADLLGHEHVNITFGRYGMAHPLKTIQTVVETLNFEECLAHVKPFKT